MDERVWTSWEKIEELMVKAFVKVGVPKEDALVCADVLMESDRRGIESHGVNRFKPIYIDRIMAKIQQPKTKIEILRETPTTAVLDGHDGMGMVVSKKAMEMAIEKAKLKSKAKPKDQCPHSKNKSNKCSRRWQTRSCPPR